MVPRILMAGGAFVGVSSRADCGWWWPNV